MLLGRLNLVTNKLMVSLTHKLMFNKVARLQEVPLWGRILTRGPILQTRRLIKDLFSPKKLTSHLSPDRLDAPHSQGQGITLDSEVAILNRACLSTPNRVTICRVLRPTGNLLSMVCPLVKARAVEFPPSLTFLILQRRREGAVQCHQAIQPLVCLPPILRRQDLLASLHSLFSPRTPCPQALNGTLSQDLLSYHEGQV